MAHAAWMARGTRGVCVFAPAPLFTATIEPGEDGGEELHLHPGGQGYWVGRMVRLLGHEVVLCAPLGGETGDVVAHLLGRTGIRCRSIAVAGVTGAYVHDRRGGARRELWQSGFSTLSRHELDELYTVTLAEAIAAGVCVLTGTQEAVGILPDSTYCRLANDLRANGVRVVCDLAGPALEAALDGGVELVKISQDELASIGLGAADAGPREAIARLRERGADGVVVSRDSDGVLAHLDGQLFEARGPRMAVADARGAGDAMTGALAVALADDSTPHELLRLALAAGAVNVTRHGLGSGRSDAVAEVARNVEVRTTATGGTHEDPGHER